MGGQLDGGTKKLNKIKQRREVYKRFRHNRDSKLWTEYCKLRKEVKQLVIEKKLDMWNNIVEKATASWNNIVEKASASYYLQRF